MKSMAHHLERGSSAPEVETSWECAVERILDPSSGWNMALLSTFQSDAPATMKQHDADVVERPASAREHNASRTRARRTCSGGTVSRPRRGTLCVTPRCMRLLCGMTDALLDQLLKRLEVTFAREEMAWNYVEDVTGRVEKHQRLVAPPLHDVIPRHNTLAMLTLEE
jgi:hypothetical protein